MKIDSAIFEYAINCANDGIVIADMTKEDQPIIFINKAFEKMTGYVAKEVVGKNCRFLQGELTDQKALDIVRTAIRNHHPCRVCLVNFTKSGSKFYNELSLAPVFDGENRLTHYIGIQKDITIQKKYESMLIKKSQTDPLTHLHNRRSIRTYWNTILEKSQKDHFYLAVSLIDIDDFKEINDNYGHDAGDEALKHLSEALVTTHRQSDLIVRMGGDEFCTIVISDIPIDPTEYTDNLKEKVNKYIESCHLPYKLSYSIGCVALNNSGAIYKHTIHELIESADKIMYENKRKKNRHV